MRKSTRIAATVASAGLIAAAMAAPASAKPAWTEKTGKSIVELASSSDSFNILTAALVESGAVGLFDGTDYTVFAPVDSAFMALYPKLSEGEIIEALGAEEGALAKSLLPVLAYHVTEGVRNSKSVTSAKQITMLSGGTITARQGLVDAAGSDAKFVLDKDGKPVIDIRATDGIIHVIDTVLIPKM